MLFSTSSLIMFVYYQNVNRIRSKTNAFYLNVLNSDFDIIALTETNLNFDISDSELFDDRFIVFRRDRSSTYSSKKDGGGVLIAVNKRCNVTRQTSWESDAEDVWISIIPTCDNEPLLNICCCYIPPDISLAERAKFYDHIQNIILNLKGLNDFLFLGDFNTPNILWEKSPVFNSLIPCNPRGSDSDLLLEFMSICNLNQFNFISNINKRHLDLIFSNLMSLPVHSCEALSKVDPHHPPLFVEVISSCQIRSIKPNMCRRLNFSKCDYSSVKRELEMQNWYMSLSSGDINVVVNEFYLIIYKVIEKYTPFMKKHPHNIPFWFSTSLINCLSEKKKFHSRFKKYKNPRDYDTFSMLRSRCKTLMKECFDTYISSIENNLTCNIKAFWSFINAKRNSCSIPHTMTFGNSFASDAKGICELFASFFCTVYENSSNINVENMCDILGTNYFNNTLSSVHITKENILLKLKHLDANKGAGPDRIPPSFWKSCADELCLPLFIIFNKSLCTGTFPEIWKKAFIIPVYKSGDKSQCENYRPISILSSVAKIFESLVYEPLYNLVSPIISSKQHGFIKNRSTVSNLLIYKNYLCSAFAKRQQVDSIYTDFRKAFDKVNHILLTKKLAAYGVCGDFFRWISSYLSRRNQLVALKGYQSNPVAVPSGVPQGSHLGPLFFNIFINDLIDRISCPCLLYADDLKIFKTIDNPYDALILQKDLETLANWCHYNKMSLNVQKCFVISFTRNNSKILTSYNIDGHILQRNVNIKDLGVIFDDKLSFRDHYDYLFKKANSLSGFVFRTTQPFTKIKSVLTVYYALVRSVLEYGAVIWSPYYLIHTNRLDSIQNKFLKMISFRFGFFRKLQSYQDRLAIFNVRRLNQRRNYIDLIFLHKIIHSYIDSPELLSLINFNTCYKSRNPNFFALQIFKNNTSFFNPLTRMCRLYNELVKNNKNLDITCTNCSSFKSAIRKLVYN